MEIKLTEKQIEQMLKDRWISVTCNGYQIYAEIAPSGDFSHGEMIFKAGDFTIKHDLS